MKGKSIFTKLEALEIEKLIEQKCKASSEKQKGIRDKIRKLGFYASDFGVGNGYTVSDFRRVVKIVKSADTILAECQAPVKSVFNEKAKSPILESSLEMLSLNHAEDIITQLKDLDFQGFVTISQLKQNNKIIPQTKGVYIILKTAKKYAFREIGSGGYFKGKDPNVSLDELKANWVDNSQIVYIGKAGSTSNASTLQSRLIQYFKFGQGNAVGHQGGRYIWQLEEAEELTMCWKTIEGIEPETVETNLIKEFTRYYGKRPFANLKD